VLDDICVTNTNRQIHALNGNFGKQKTEAMAERVAAINPACNITKLNTFYSKRNADELLSNHYVSPSSLVVALEENMIQQRSK